MTVLLINAMYAARRLAAYHRERIKQTRGGAQTYHHEMAACCGGDIASIEGQIMDGGLTVEHQVRTVHAGDMATARKLIEAHFLPEWRADERTSQIMLRMTQAIADALQDARGANGTRE